MSFSDYYEGLKDGARIGFKAGFKAGWEIGQQSGYLSGYHDGYCDKLKGLDYKPVDRFLEHRKLFPDPPKIDVDVSLSYIPPKLPEYKPPIFDPPKLDFVLDPPPSPLRTLPDHNFCKKPWE